MVRLVVLTGLVVAAGLGCDGDSSAGGAAGAPTSTTVVSEVTTTTAAPVSFEDEVKQAAIDLLEVRNEVFQSPDVSRVPEYIAETCVCLERERGFIERFETEGLRWTAAVVEVRGMTMTDPDPDGPSLALVARQPAAQLVSDSDELVEQATASDEAAYRMSLVREEGGWRINSFEGTELDEATVTAVLAEGVP